MARKVTKKTTKKKTTTKKKATKKKKKASTKVVHDVDVMPKTEVVRIETAAELRIRLRFYWQLPIADLKEIAKDPNTMAQDVSLIKQILNLCYTGEAQEFIFFLNLVLKGGNVPGLDFDLGDEDESYKQSQVQLVLPSNGSENLDHYSPKDLIKGGTDD